MSNALIVADDLTGTLDTGHGFAARDRGVTARLLGADTPTGADAIDADEHPADVLAVDTDSRDVDPETAARAVEAVVSGTDADLTYKKIDSTLRGNVVAEVDAALDGSDAAAGIIAPAFPETERTTRDGVHFVEGVPLAEAGYGVSESSLLDVFAGSANPVRQLSLASVEANTEAVADALRELIAAAATPPLIICDATTTEHLASIAAGANALNDSVLYVGSGGLATHVTVPGEPSPLSPPPRTGRGVVAVVGSVNPRTLDQLDGCPPEDILHLDPAEAVRDPDGAAEAAASDLKRRIRERERAVLTAALDPSDVERAQTAATRLSTQQETADTPDHTYPVDAGDRISRALAETTRLILTGRDAVDPARLFLTGGDVARSTLDLLSVTSVQLTGRAVGHGLPEGWIADGPAAGTHLVTKAGGFGDRGAIVNCLCFETDEYA